MKLCIEIHGPGRDYDYSSFCSNHNVAAEQCATEWICHLVDSLDPNEEGSVTVKTHEWIDDEDECSVCDLKENNE